MAIPIPIIDGVMNLGNALIERLWPNPAEADKAKLELMRMHQEGELQKLTSSASIVLAEAQSEHWLTANWRPLTMMVFTVIIANNYIIYPYLSLFWTDAPVLELPQVMWDTFKIGLGGYVVGRSGEKMVKLWKA